MVDDEGVAKRLDAYSKSLGGDVEVGNVHVAGREDSPSEDQRLELGIVEGGPIYCVGEIDVEKKRNQPVSSGRDVLGYGHPHAVHFAVLAFPSDLVVDQRVWASGKTAIIEVEKIVLALAAVHILIRAEFAVRMAGIASIQSGVKIVWGW